MTRQLLLILIIACGIAACSTPGGAEASASISEAEDALNAGYATDARSIADALSGDTTATLSATELCRLSIIYMKISDIEETDINTTLATRCYRRAIAADADSAAYYYENLPLEESRHVDLMSKLAPMLSSDRDTYIDEDSLEYDFTISATPEFPTDEQS